MGSNHGMTSISKETFLKAREMFLGAVRKATGGAPSEVEPGRIVRFSTSDKRGDTSGWAKLFDDEQGGAYGCWRQGISGTWQAREPRSPEERQAFAEHVRQARAAAERLLEEQRAECREKSAELWERGRDVDGKHPYLLAKNVKPFGLKQIKNMIVVPVRDSDGTLNGLQFIMPDGSKKFKTGTMVAGCYFAIGTLKGNTLLICEGLATGLSLYQATGHMVVVAFSAGNLKPVAEALLAKHPDIEIILCSDDDFATQGNPGLCQATEAARAINGKLAVPSFQNASTRGTDFNDLRKIRDTPRFIGKFGKLEES